MRASELDPSRSQRFPKACKIQMFSREEQIWLDIVKVCVQAGKSPYDASFAANGVLRHFKERFGE